MASTHIADRKWVRVAADRRNVGSETHCLPRDTGFLGRCAALRLVLTWTAGARQFAGKDGAVGGMRKRRLSGDDAFADQAFGSGIEG